MKYGIYFHSGWLSFTLKSSRFRTSHFSYNKESKYWIKRMMEVGKITKVYTPLLQNGPNSVVVVSRQASNKPRICLDPQRHEQGSIISSSSNANIRRNPSAIVFIQEFRNTWLQTRFLVYGTWWRMVISNKSPYFNTFNWPFVSHILHKVNHVRYF